MTGPDTPPCSARRAWTRVTAGVVLSALAVSAIPLAVRWSGLRALRATVERHRAAGLGALPADALAAAPPADALALDRLTAAEQRLQRGWSPDFAATARDWVHGYESKPPSALPAWVATHAAAVAARDVILGTGGTPIHAGAGVAVSPGRVTPAVVSTLMRGNFMGAKVAARWHRAKAALTRDAGPHLDALDRDREARRRPGLLGEAMVALDLAAARDNAYLEAALRGDLPREREDAWCAEEDPAPALLAEGLRGERLLVGGAVAQGFLEEGVAARDVAGPGSAPGAALEVWVHGPGDCARYLERLAEAEARLRSAPPPPLATMEGAVGDVPGAGRILLHQVRNSLLGADRGLAGHRVLHRAARVVVRLVRVAEERGRLPTDDGELRAWLGGDTALLDGDLVEDRLHYELLADEGVRLVPDPDVPPPGGWAEATAVDGVLRRRAAKSPSGDPVRWQGAHLRIVVPRPGRGE